MLTKICATCKIEKSSDCFHKAKKEKDGLQYRCIGCGKKYHADRYVNQKEKISGQIAAYRAGNKDKLNEAGKVWRSKNPDKVKHYQRTTNLKKNFGLSIADYEKMAEAQNNACAICLTPETFVHKAKGQVARLAVDHCHASGKIRKLLCANCNRALGLFNDNPYIMEFAAKYIRAHNG